MGPVFLQFRKRATYTAQCGTSVSVWSDEGMLMDFTINFLWVFFLDVIHAGPLLAFFVFAIGLIGHLIGKLEGWSGSDALYHAFVTATTVGYGDFRPTKGPAKALAVALAFVGLIFTGMIVAIALHAANYAFAEVYQMSGLLRR
jgi:voltage-gated potassium channel